MSGADGAALRGAALADPALEADYRRHHLHDDARATTIFLLAALAASALFVPSDFRLLGGTPALPGLLAVRATYLALTLGGLALLWRAREPGRFDALVAALTLVLVAQAFAVGVTRPRDHTFNLVTEVSLVGAFWAFVPIRFWLQAVVSGTHLAAALALLAWFRDPLPPLARGAVAGGFALAIGTGAAMSLRLQRARRRQYLALRREAQARQALEAALTTARAADRSKTVFLANVSHEILTPLNAILGFSEVLLRRGHPADREPLEAIQASGRALHGLLADVLDLARGEATEAPPRPVRCAPRALLEDVGRMMAARCEARGLALRVEADPGLPPALLLDEARLRQVLLNLVSNALRFTRQGRITLRGVAAPAADGQVALRLEVADTGAGVPPDLQPLVFEPFQRGEAGEPGTPGGAGLGLWVSRRLVERMGGRLTLASEPGQGSTFAVLLPGVPVLPAEGAPAAAGGTWRLPEATLLVADDHPANRALLRAFLEDQPVRVVEAAGGAEAIEALRAARPDAALLDLRMPGTDGHAVARWARATAALDGLPLLALSAAAPGTPAPHGFDALLPKPVSREALLEALGRLLPGARRVPAAAAAPPDAPPAPPGLADALERDLLPAALALAEVPSAAGALALAERAGALAAEAGDAGLAEWSHRVRRAATGLDAAALGEALAALGAEAARLRGAAGSAPR